MDEPFLDYRMVDVNAPIDPPPDRVAPLDDHRTNRWLRLGIRLAGSTTRASEPVLWPSEFDYNPMMVYLTGRRRNLWIEDLIGLMPWGMLSLIETLWVFGFVASGRFGAVLQVILVAAILLPPFVGLWTAWMALRSWRDTIDRVAFDQIAVTRLSAAQILHGILIRPLAVQILGCLANVLLWIPNLIAISLTAETPVQAVYQIGSGIALLLLRWALFTACMMTGGVLALRASVFLRSHPMVRLRVISDWTRKMLIPFALPFLALLLSAAAVLTQILLSLGCVFVLVHYVRQGFRAEESLRWVAEHQDRWWSLSGEEDPAIPVAPWSPWKAFPEDAEGYIPLP